MQQRSQQQEWIDLGPEFYSATEYAQCLRLLFRINCLLGFFYSTRRALKNLPHKTTLLDVGCGNGLFLLHLSRYYPDFQLRGIDVSAQAIALAEHARLAWRVRGDATEVSFAVQPQLRLNLPAQSVDIVLTTLVCHHIQDEELVLFLREVYQAARVKVIINDLHRHRLAYWLYALTSPWLFRNRLITHDGLVSIQRGFKRAEWQALLIRAGITRYQIKWQFPFRWSVILWNN